MSKRHSIPVGNRSSLLSVEGFYASRSLGVGHAKDYSLAENPSGPRNRIEHSDVMRVQQAVQLRPARAKFLRHGLLRLLPFTHCIFKLPGQGLRLTSPAFS